MSTDNSCANGILTWTLQGWGDGSGGSSSVGGSAISASHIVYGRIPARQNANVGSYADNLTVALSFWLPGRPR